MIPNSNNHLKNNRASSVWAVFGVFFIALALVFGVFTDTALAMYATWLKSETYNHCLFVIPAFLYFVWTKKHQIIDLPNPTIWGMVPVAGSGLIWLIGSLADVDLVKQFGLVSMLVSVTSAFAGLKLTKQLLFPLGFLYLAVPFGEELLPVMIDFTATFTVTTLKLMGYPVFREGTFFSMPSGNWSVVEACSGVRYLIASVTMGLIYAYLTYTSMLKRSVFVVVSIIVPIIANGLRAVIIVLLGHYSGMTIATGVDHLIYGWLFFGIVIFALFWVGSYWRDPLPDQVMENGNGADASESISLTRLINPGNIGVAVAILSSLLIWPLWLDWMNDRKPGENAKHEFVINGAYEPCSICKTQFTPAFKSADHVIHQIYVDDAGREIGVFIASYYSWTQTGELVSYQNQLVLPADDDYRIVNQRVDNGHRFIQIKGQQRLLASDLYLVNHDPFSSKVMVKLEEAKRKLLGDFLVSQYVAIYTQDTDSEEAKNTLKSFLQNNFKSLTSSVVVPNE